MRKILLILSSLFILSSSVYADLARYSCPSPEQVKCVPSDTTLGMWKHNGGQMTGNTFAANNQCANIIALSSSESRLFCCYTKCGVFYVDVKHNKCSKLSQSIFRCE